MHNLTHKLESAFFEDALGRLILRKCMRAHDLCTSGSKCEIRQSPCCFSGISPTLILGHDAIGDLNNGISIWWSRESGAADHQPVFPMNSCETMQPWICACRGAKSIATSR